MGHNYGFFSLLYDLYTTDIEIILEGALEGKRSSSLTIRTLITEVKLFMSIAQLLWSQTSITMVKIGALEGKNFPHRLKFQSSKKLFLQVRNSLLCVKKSWKSISRWYCYPSYTQVYRSCLQVYTSHLLVYKNIPRGIEIIPVIIQIVLAYKKSPCRLNIAYKEKKIWYNLTFLFPCFIIINPIHISCRYRDHAHI